MPSDILLDPYILAMPDVEVYDDEFKAYLENLWRWMRELKHMHCTFWLSEAILSALYQSKRLPRLRNVDPHRLNDVEINVLTILDAIENEVIQPPFLENLFPDEAFTVENTLLIPEEITQRLSEDLVTALQDTLSLAALGAYKKLNPVFTELAFGTVPDGFHENSLQVGAQAMIGEDKVLSVEKKFPIFTSPNDVLLAKNLNDLWPDIGQMIRQQFALLYGEATIPVQISAHSDFIDKVSSFTTNMTLLTRTIRRITNALTGDIPAKKHHPLYNEPEIDTSKGKIVAMRLWIVDKKPGWRVHYWRYPDGSIELSCFVNHDNYSIPAPLRINEFNE